MSTWSTELPRCFDEFLIYRIRKNIRTQKCLFLIMLFSQLGLGKSDDRESKRQCVRKWKRARKKDFNFDGNVTEIISKIVERRRKNIRALRKRSEGLD